MKRFVMAIALVCALAVTGLAGDIHTTGSPEPPPGTTLAGETYTTGAPESPSLQESATTSSTTLTTVLLIILNAVST